MRDFVVLDEVICMSGASWSTEASLISLLPNNVRSVLDKWKAINVAHVPWVCNLNGFTFVLKLRRFLPISNDFQYFPSEYLCQ